MHLGCAESYLRELKKNESRNRPLPFETEMRGFLRLFIIDSADMAYGKMVVQFRSSLRQPWRYNTFSYGFFFTFGIRKQT